MRLRWRAWPVCSGVLLQLVVDGAAQRAVTVEPRPPKEMDAGTIFSGAR